MKTISLFRVAIVSLVVLFIQNVDCRVTKSTTMPAKVFAVNTKAVEVSTTEVVAEVDLAKQFVETQLIVKNAQTDINTARELLLADNNDDEKNTQKIIDLIMAKTFAEQKLMTLNDALAKKVEANITQEGYVSKFVTGAKNVGFTIAGYLSAGTGTPEQKETARMITKGLVEQEVMITQKYALLQKNLSADDQAQLKSRYDAIIVQLEAAIYEQQLISGDSRNSMIKRGLLLGAAAAGTAAVGLMLKDKYFMDEQAPATETSEQEIIAPQEEQTMVPMMVEASTVSTSRKPVSRSAMEREAQEYARQTSVPYRVGTWIKEAPGKAYDAATDFGSQIRAGFERGADREDYMEETYGTAAGEYLKDAYGKVKDAAVKAYDTAKDYLTSSGQPAQNPEDVEGFVAQDYQPVADYFTAPGESAQNPEDVEGFVREDYAPLAYTRAGSAAYGTAYKANAKLRELAGRPLPSVAKVQQPVVAESKVAQPEAIEETEQN